MVINKLSKSNDCECEHWDDLCIVNMTSDTCPHFFDKFEDIVRKGQPQWWLSVRKCKKCNEHWLVAQEERTNDIFCLNRLNKKQVDDIINENIWPAVFDRYETLLEIAKQNNLCYIFFDPINDSPIIWTIEDLALERPYIKISELAKLLNIKSENAVKLSKKAIEKNPRLNITFDV